MTDDRPSMAMSIAKATLCAAISFVWGGALIWFAGDADPHSPGDAQGHFSFLATGTIMISVGMVVIIYTVLKARAPSKQSERPTEAADLNFDPDAAVERYLASKQKTDASGEQASESGEQTGPPLAVRPVFGRRVDPPPPQV